MEKGKEQATSGEVQLRKQGIDLKNKIAQAEREVKAIVVFGIGDVDNAGVWIKKIKQLESIVDNFRKDAIAPHKEIIDRTNSWAKKVVSELSKERERLLTEVNIVNKKFMEEQKAIQEAEKKELMDYDKQAEELFGVDETEKVELQFRETKMKDVSTQMTTVTSKEWRLKSIKDVPKFWKDREGKEQLLLIVDTKTMDRIRKTFDADAESTIPGIEFYKETSARIK